MGGPRASSIRQIRRGERCSLCETFLGAEGARGCERMCARCIGQPYIRVLMNCMLRDDWAVHFLYADCKTSVCRRSFPITLERLTDICNRFGEPHDLHAMKRTIETGRGGFWLRLPIPEFVKLIERR